MAEWKEYTVADVISTVIDYRGKTPKKLGGDWSDSGYRALSAKNIKTGKIVQSESIRYVSEDMYRCWMKEEVQKDRPHPGGQTGQIGQCHRRALRQGRQKHHPEEEMLSRRREEQKGPLVFLQQQRCQGIVQGEGQRDPGRIRQ